MKNESGEERINFLKAVAVGEVTVENINFFAKIKYKRVIICMMSW